MSTDRRHARILPMLQGALRAGLAAFLFTVPLCCAAESAGFGSGFFITADGYVVTNFHVVQGASKAFVRDYRGRQYPAEFVQKDATNDLAIIKVKGNFTPLQIVRSSAVRRGDAVFTLGFRTRVSKFGGKPKVRQRRRIFILC